MLCATDRGGIVQKALKTPFLVWVGTFSYSLYLIHFPIQQLIWQIAFRNSGLGHPAVFFLMATFGTALLVAISRGFYLLCEKPFVPGASKAK